jgi:hypothetical protein
MIHMLISTDVRGDFALAGGISRILGCARKGEGVWYLIEWKLKEEMKLNMKIRSRRSLRKA